MVVVNEIWIPKVLLVRHYGGEAMSAFAERIARKYGLTVRSEWPDQGGEPVSCPMTSAISAIDEAVEECAKAADYYANALQTKATGDDYEPGSRDWCEVMDQACGARKAAEVIRAMVSK